MSSPLPVALGQIVAEKYQVDSVIGQGGMGVVMVAHHIDLDQKVAIKFLLADVIQHADAAERFRREARAVAKIHSDHVVRVLDVGVLPDNIPFMVMEYLEGRDLGAKMSAGEHFSVEEAVGYALETIDAIAQAHGAGIVHRDLKPANLFLARRPDGSHRIKVLDFGISKSLVESSISAMRLTSTTTLIGSPLYMSPEQMQSARDVDGRADIWSLGAILFEMLAGRPPYQANTLPQLCQELLTRDPPKLRELRPDVPEGVEAAVVRCLMRDVDERWQDVRELAAALKPFSPRHQSHRPEFGSQPGSFPPEIERSSQSPDPLAGSSGGSRPPGTLDPWGNTQTKRQRQRNRVLVLVPLAVLALALLGLLIVRESGRTSDAAASGGSPSATPTVHDDQTSVHAAEAAPNPGPPEGETIVRPVDSAEVEREPETPSAPAVRPPVGAAVPIHPPAGPGRPPPVAPPPDAAASTASGADDAPAASTPPAGDVSDFGGRR